VKKECADRPLHSSAASLPAHSFSETHVCVRERVTSEYITRSRWQVSAQVRVRRRVQKFTMWDGTENKRASMTFWRMNGQLYATRNPLHVFVLRCLLNMCVWVWEREQETGGKEWLLAVFWECSLWFLQLYIVHPGRISWDVHYCSFFFSVYQGIVSVM